MQNPTDRIAHTTAFVTTVMEHWLEREIAQWVHPMKGRSDDPSHHKRTFLPRSYNWCNKECDIILSWGWYIYQKESTMCWQHISSLIIIEWYFTKETIVATTGVTKNVILSCHGDGTYIRKSPQCVGNTFLRLLSEWTLTICLLLYNCKIKCVECII